MKIEKHKHKRRKRRSLDEQENADFLCFEVSR